jgi:non-haem dioxygenase in morphine synthesis N-terminal
MGRAQRDILITPLMPVAGLTTIESFPRFGQVVGGAMAVEISDFSFIPSVSLAGLGNDAAKTERIVAEIGSACENAGFFYLVDHGIPDGAIDAIFAAAQAFVALPKSGATRSAFIRRPISAAMYRWDSRGRACRDAWSRPSRSCSTSGRTILTSGPAPRCMARTCGLRTRRRSKVSELIARARRR